MDQRGASGKRVAFFGGSFDPPHSGHVAVANAAQASLALDTVLFAPVGTQPLKPMGSMASFADRMAMTALAISGEAGFEVSSIDAPNSDGTPNYTFDTILQLRGQLTADSILYCLMGADSFLNLKNWRRAAELPFLAPFIVASRPRESMEDLKAALPSGLSVEPVSQGRKADSGVSDSKIAVKSLMLKNEAGQLTPFYLLPGLHEDISASQIREAISVHKGAHGSIESLTLGSTDEFISAAVLDYIREHGLYR